MDVKFADLVDSLAPKLAALLEQPACKNGRLPIGLPYSGVYLFSEGDRHLYVGRSNNVRRRYGLHTRPSSQHNQASFAYRLACEDMSLRPQAYQPGGGRKAHAAIPEFIDRFARAKARVREMDFRYVEQTDQVYQAVLEIYVAVVLNTPYNDFSNH